MQSLKLTSLQNNIFSGNDHASSNTHGGCSNKAPSVGRSGTIGPSAGAALAHLQQQHHQGDLLSMNAG